MRFITKFFIVFFVFAIATFYILFSSFNVLIIKGEKDSTALLLKDGDVIELKFRHSVELTDYVEVYEVKSGYLILKEAKTQSLGWGLPFNGNFSFEDNYLVYRYNKKFKELYIATSDINDYTLIVKGKVIKLENFGKMVKLGVDDIWHWTYQRLKESLYTKESYLAGKQS